MPYSSFSSTPLIPLLIAVTGHRDLVPDEVPRIRQSVREFFGMLQREFPGRPLQVLSALAEGADQLVAEEALALDIALAAILPMAQEKYLETFSDPVAKTRLQELCARAAEVITLPEIHLPPDAPVAYTAHEAMFAEQAIYLCKHCHILLALWDGKATADIGGTSQTIHFHQNDAMPGYIPATTIKQQLLADDESDLVFHIVVSRQRGIPANGLEALACSWFTTDKDTPRTPGLPAKYASMFRDTATFNSDVAQHYAAISRGAGSLLKLQPDAAHAQPAARVHRFFVCADWLAVLYQKRMRYTLIAVHLLSLITGTMFLLYSSLAASPVYLWVFSSCLLLAMALHKLAGRAGWQRKYLEYRILAENLRIQFYWILAGVVSAVPSKFAVDNYRMKQDPELGWTRNVLRFATLGSDLPTEQSSSTIQQVIREWLGDESSQGQLQYYRKRLSLYLGRKQRMETAAVVLGWAVVILLLMTLATSSVDLQSRLFVAVGVLVLAYSVRQAYSYKSAEVELIREFGFMLSIFANARHRMDLASNDTERLHILRVLGESALDEHADWILRHRERPLDQTELLQLGM